MSVNKPIKFQIKILSGCWENSKKIRGLLNFPHPVYTQLFLDFVIFWQVIQRLYLSEGRECIQRFVRDRLTMCVSDVAKWCASRRLQLNIDNTETIWFGSNSNLAKLQRTNQSLQVEPSDIQPSSVVRGLGVYLDSELTMKQHITETAAACFYHIRWLRQICRRIGQEVTQQLVIAFITSRLDYCNTLLAGLPRSTSTSTECSCLAALWLRSIRFTPSLIQVHWLPVIYRVKFKLCCIIYAIYIHHGRSPTYLSEAVQLVSTSRSRSGLQSSSTSLMDYALPRLHIVLE